MHREVFMPYERDIRTIRDEGITLTMLGLTIAVAMFATAAAVIWFAIASGPT